MNMNVDSCVTVTFFICVILLVFALGLVCGMKDTKKIHSRIRIEIYDPGPLTGSKSGMYPHATVTGNPYRWPLSTTRNPNGSTEYTLNLPWNPMEEK